MLMVRTFTGSSVCEGGSNLTWINLILLRVPPSRVGTASLEGRILGSPTPSFLLPQSHSFAPPQKIVFPQGPMEERNECEATVLIIGTSHSYLRPRPDPHFDFPWIYFSLNLETPDGETFRNTLTLIHTSAHLPRLTHTYLCTHTPKYPWSHICSRITHHTPIHMLSNTLNQGNVHIHAFTCLHSI